MINMVVRAAPIRTRGHPAALAEPAGMRTAKITG